MAWLEMSRYPDKRPAGWRVGECLWSPRLKEGGAKWGFWETMRELQPGDAVFHLCGHSGKAAFTGFSTAASPCVSVDEGPYGREELYRVDLENHKTFESPIRLADVFKNHDAFFRSYFFKNFEQKKAKERLFYVVQRNQLQCLNGAYLSQLSPSLLEHLFGIHAQSDDRTSSAVASNTSTGTALKEAAVRVGQQGFARNVKSNYQQRCAFPFCTVDDPRFLIGAHIARWADAEHLRGETSNGICLCVLHDKAFELGAFTIAPDNTIALNPKVTPESWLFQFLSPCSGHPLLRAAIPPSTKALRHHWVAHGYTFKV